MFSTVPPTFEGNDLRQLLIDCKRKMVRDEICSISVLCDEQIVLQWTADEGIIYPEFNDTTSVLFKAWEEI